MSLLLRTPREVVIASGDLLQVARDGEVTRRLVFRFRDGSVFDETVVFTQGNVLAMQSYRLVQRGPVFPEDTEISLERDSGKYHVKTAGRDDGREKTLDGTIGLPPDAYNGMVPVVLKNLPGGARETIHMVLFTPAPKLIRLDLVPVGEDRLSIGGSDKRATRYVVKPVLGIWIRFIAALLGRMPPDNHVWIIPADVPEFVRFEGQLYMNGPVWRIEPANPRPAGSGSVPRPLGNPGLSRLRTGAVPSVPYPWAMCDSYPWQELEAAFRRVSGSRAGICGPPSSPSSLSSLRF